MTKDHAKGIAVTILQAIAADEGLAGHFMEISGLTSLNLREAASDLGFLRGVLDHVALDDNLMTSCAEAIGAEPETIGQARQALVGS